MSKTRDDTSLYFNGGNSIPPVDCHDCTDIKGVVSSTICKVSWLIN